MKRVLALFFSLALTSGPLLSATLNFDTVRSGVSILPIDLPQATISQPTGDGLYVYNTGLFDMPVGGGICGLHSGFSSCKGDISLLFKNPVSNLKFRGYKASISDSATITAYANDLVVANLLVSGTPENQVDIDFKGVSGITRLEFADGSRSLSRGIAYGSFSFDIDPPRPPDPPKPPPDFLSFDTFKDGVNADRIDLGKAVLSQTSGGKIFVYRTGTYGLPQNGGLCAYEDDTCLGDLLLEFKVPIVDLIFAGFFAKPTDSAFISLFDGDALLFRERFYGNPAGTIRFDFSDVTRLTKLLIEDSSAVTSSGIAYGDFKFRDYVAPAPSPIPLPGSLFLLLASLIVFSILGFARNVRYMSFDEYLRFSHR